jgi:hypothetical protein
LFLFLLLQALLSRFLLQLCCVQRQTGLRPQPVLQVLLFLLLLLLLVMMVVVVTLLLPLPGLLLLVVC